MKTQAACNPLLKIKTLCQSTDFLNLQNPPVPNTHPFELEYHSKYYTYHKDKKSAPPPPPPPQPQKNAKSLNNPQQTQDMPTLASFRRHSFSYEDYKNNIYNKSKLFHT
ncbi:hypothetical protein TBLA_0C01550 [Henningerozyma blattae CBS 6284]|uniref:Uncharacterized protein n=1 Tax=Henningerozyma blattae (strain ATCC 34711 / CBS 6284 / DSM 70876 / NBRC 10599 / NRRL Y-10934 / UCD 77-7) TaxID=1071380 RepID=I2H0R7_HENB6|nr:hypothetical protein TBLA_0C01550 [Tetrapisispora blattae CBS 6284]CCH59969.1 hypothetical protein TBLA_0C01550 [Tetrapisispora blattae CBS 6284]